MTSPADEIDRELSCACLRSRTDDTLDHLVSFNTAQSISIEAGERYRLMPILSILFVHPIVMSDYFGPHSADIYHGRHIAITQIAFTSAGSKQNTMKKKLLAKMY